jgi:hypothetical protein
VADKEAVCAALNINSEALTEKYLGLPSHVGIERSDCFQHLVDHLCQIINGWNEKNLSMGGKEILLKAVAQAIPTYAMSVFKIPKGIIKAILAAIARYWWGRMERRLCTGILGGRCAPRRRKAAWGLETCTALTLRCLPNKYGG